MATLAQDNERIRHRMTDNANREIKALRSELLHYADCFSKVECAKIRAAIKALEAVAKFE